MNPELARRIAFTLGALLVYRIGSQIPLPGISANVWEQALRAQQDGIPGMLNALSGGLLGRLSVFALFVMPYVSSAIVIQLGGFLVRRLHRLQHAGERGDRQVGHDRVAPQVVFEAGDFDLGVHQEPAQRLDRRGDVLGGSHWRIAGQRLDPFGHRTKVVADRRRDRTDVADQPGEETAVPGLVGGALRVAVQRRREVLDRVVPHRRGAAR